MSTLSEITRITEWYKTTGKSILSVSQNVEELVEYSAELSAHLVDLSSELGNDIVGLDGDELFESKKEDVSMAKAKSIAKGRHPWIPKMKLIRQSADNMLQTMRTHISYLKEEKKKSSNVVRNEA